MEGPKASNLHTPNIDNIVDEENPFFGYVSSLERALEIVRDYEIATTTKFTVYTETKHFGAAGKLHTALRANI
jgi:IMP cyclohydrolase